MENEQTIQPEVAPTSNPAAPAGANEAAPASTAASATAPAGSSFSPEQIAELQAKAAKADEHWDRLLRQAAEFDNYRKRTVRERQDAVKYANQGLLEKLIPVLDHFEMALVASQGASAETLESFRTGMVMIQNQLKSALGEAGLEEIDALRQPFDPNFHEAVSQLESVEVPEGHVAQQLRKGYKLRDRLLRPATVVVAKKPTA